MGAPLLDITFRPGWQGVVQRINPQNARLWLSMCFTVAGVALFPALLAPLVAPPAKALRIILFVAVFWIVPLWYPCRPTAGHGSARGLCLGLLAIVGAEIMVAMLTGPLAGSAAKPQAVTGAVTGISFGSPCDS